MKMKTHKLLVIVAVVGGIPASMRAYGSETPGAAEVTCELVVDFSKSVGSIRPYNGVNNGPFAAGQHTADMNARHREAAFPSVRLHDCHWPHPDVVDIPAIFPLFHADADDPNNYVFGPTDRYIGQIAERGAEIVYRLGVSIEHKPAFNTQPPADFEKWAKICVNVIRHYNDGWAGGKQYGIRYFEIWNEPDIGPRMWTGTPQQYFDLYRVAVTTIKAYNPTLRIGGQVSFVKGKYTRPFLAYCRDQKLPLDFFSWHRYSDSPTDLIQDARLMRSLLDEYDFKAAESLCTEWRPMLDGFNKVSWRPDRQAGSVRAAFARNRNHESAAFAASALMQMQDVPLDRAHYYTADDSPWSMFDEFGEPGKVFFAFKAFSLLLQTSNRVAVTGAPGGDEVTACCGMANDGKSAGLLLSNYRGKPADLRIELKGGGLDGDIQLERFMVDQAHDCAPLAPLVISATNRMLRLSLPPATVIFVRLSQVCSGLPATGPGEKDTCGNPGGPAIAIRNGELAVVLGASPSLAEKRAVELLAERIKDRSGVMLAESSDKAKFRLVIGGKESSSLGDDAYSIVVDVGKRELGVAGQTDSGVVAGVGRLMREMRYRQGSIEVPALQVTEVPQMPNRGMYLWARKHFFGQPDRVDNYIEEFALWGGNALTFWFEMGLFESFDDPEAQRWLAMYRRFYETARGVGMKTGLLMVINDAYKSSSQALRITPIIGCPKHYLCPSKPGSVKQMMAWQEEVFKALGPINIFNLFPADPGGCSCADCTPWPTRGFWRMAEPLADRIHEISPRTEIWVDTWHLNHPTFGGKDWMSLVSHLDRAGERPAWFAGFEVGLAPKHPFAAMTSEDRKCYNEARQPLMVFPDVSMWRNHQGMLVKKAYWASLQAELNEYAPGLMKGGWPYSERWNTDIANVAFLSWFWNSKKTVDEVLDEYASFYFGPEAETGRKLLELLDDDCRDPDRNRKIHQTLAKVEESAPDWVKRDWRWQEVSTSCRRFELPGAGGVEPPRNRLGTAASSEFGPGYHAGKASDGILSSRDEENFWASANRQDVGAWWQKNLGKKTAIEKIQIQFRGFGGHYHFVPKTITFQVSDDGKKWTTVVSKSADVPANERAYSEAMYTYGIHAEGRHVRLLFEDGTDEVKDDIKVVELVEVVVIEAGPADGPATASAAPNRGDTERTAAP